MATTVEFDGYDLTANFVVSNLEREFIPREVKTIDVPGRDGSLFANVRNRSLKITMDVTALGDPATRSANLRALAAVLNVDSPKPLSFSDDTVGNKKRRYSAVPSGSGISRLVGSETFTLEFICPSPVMSSTIANFYVFTTSYTATVGGNYPAISGFTALNAAAGQDGLFTLAIDGVDMLSFEIDGTGTLQADFETRACTFDGDPIIPTLASDWPIVEPGSHTFSITSGSVSANGMSVMAWERWL